MLLFNRLIQQSGLNTLVPVYVVGVFTGDKMIAEGKVTRRFYRCMYYIRVFCILVHKDTVFSNC